MRHKRSKSRLIVMLAVAAMSIGVMSPALANQHGDVPAAQAENVDGEAVGAENAAIGAEKAAAGQLIASERETFATVTVQAMVAAFQEAVADWTGCVNDAASSNETNTEGKAINPYDECGSLDVEQSPGHYVSARFSSPLHIE